MATGTLQRPNGTRFDRQWNEAEAIRSIYYDEFEELKFPWKSDHPPHFIIHLDEVDLEGSKLSLDVEFGMVEGYPDEKPPEMKLVRRLGFTPGQLQSLKTRLDSKASSLVGGEMIFELIEEAKAHVSSLAKKKVSFHAEMVDRAKADEEQNQAVQRQKKETIDKVEEARRLQVAKEIEAKVAEEMVIKDKIVQSMRALEELAIAPPPPAIEPMTTKVSFVPELKFPVNGVETAVHQVNVVPDTSVSPWIFGDIYRATSPETGLEFSLILVHFRTPFYQTAQGRRKLEALVRNSLEISKFLAEARGLVRVLGMQLDNLQAGPVLHILTEPIRGTRMDLILSQVGSLNMKKALEHSKGILKALGHLHQQGFVHRDVALGNLYVSSDGSQISLAFASVSRALIDLDQAHPISKLRSTDPVSQVFRPPEALSKGNTALGRKTDIWHIGVILLEFLLGKETLQSFESVQDCIQSCRDILPVEVVAFLLRVTASDPGGRPVVSELLKDKVFALSDFKVLLTALPSVVPTPISKSTRFRGEEGGYSRYKTDFEEIQFLGKGAFGAVIKVRNRIDNRFYAVKRIKLDKRNQEENQKILREVTTLSRLHHDRIIRYYQAWIEGDTTGGDNETSPELSFNDMSDEQGGGESWLDGTFYDDGRNEDTHQSHSSLLDLAINHTGFSDEDDSPKLSPVSMETTFSEASEFDSGSEPEEPSNTEPYLYIQMEYCPNQTLRDYIDDGMLDMEEAWRMFRQLLEGLSYIHAQGMIHRDLKPSNIFLDSNGDIKIGDFGLAVADVVKPEEQEVRPTRSGVSLTGAVGTPFYMSPEQEREGNVRYSNKVDMYSAGVIFVELCCGHFGTTMERIEMLRAIRRPTIALPPLFHKTDMAKARTVASSLLSHDPKSRFSADELLRRADLIPPKMEDEAVAEAIRSLTVPGGPHYSRLIKELFKRRIELYKDFAYDLNSGNIHDPVLLGKISQIKARLASLYKTFGAIDLPVPSMVPATGICTSQYDDLPVFTEECVGPRQQLLDEDGVLVEVNPDLTTTFARFVAHNRLTDLKRFTFDRVYVRNPAGGQPKQLPHASFDILHQLNSQEDELISEARLLKIAYDSASGNIEKTFLTHIWIILGSTEMAFLIGKSCGLPPTQKAAFLEALYKTNGLPWIKRKALLASLLSVPPQFFESLSRFTKPVPMEKLLFLVKHEPEVADAANRLRMVVDYAASFGLDVNRILCDPLYSLSPAKYSGAVFKLQYVVDRKLSHTIAIGGRYDRLVEAYSYPRASQTGAVGFQLNLPRLAHLTTLPQPTILDAIIFSIGGPMLPEKLQICSDLWSSAIKADFVTAANPSQEQLLKICRKLGVSVFVILKEHSSKGHNGTLKVRQVEKRHEIEVSRSELVATVKNLLSVAPAEEPMVAEQPPSALPLKVHILPNPDSRAKAISRAHISEKALKAFNRVTAVMAPCKSLEIVAHYLPTPLARLAIASLSDPDDDKFRKSLNVTPDERDGIIRLRDYLKGVKDRGDIVVPVYHIQDNSIELLTFFK